LGWQTKKEINVRNSSLPKKKKKKEVRKESKKKEEKKEERDEVDRARFQKGDCLS